MTKPYHTWLGQKIGETCIRNLNKHGFDAHWAEDRQGALEVILGVAADCATVGFGGSDTTRSLGLMEALKERGKILYDHNAGGFNLTESLECRRRQLSCDCFLCSANAVAMTGEIVNVDGVGNRTSAMAFGPGKVIIVAGINKVTPDLDSAIKRVRQVAAPMRARSLGMKTPCAETGICIDCNSPQRICNITTILHRKPMMTAVSVVIVNQQLGY
ncbi:MAG: lactate utilization protein [Thermodesulfobacteriota bacterium]